MSRWNPWRALRARAHIRFALDHLPDGVGGAVYGKRGDVAAIVIDRRLSQRDRAAALAHELVHDERGCPPGRDEVPVGWWPVIVREEGFVERIVADRLVPADALRAFVDSMAEIGEPVTAAEVSEEFDIPLALAQRALETLRGRAA